MISQRKLADSLTVGLSGTVYTDSIPFRWMQGNGVAVLIVTTAGSVTITQQCSFDDSTWYDPVDKSELALGAVVSAMTVGSQYVALTPVMAPYVRYKIVEGGTGALSLTLDLAYEEDL